MLSRRQFLTSAIAAYIISGCHWLGHQDGFTYIGMSFGNFYHHSVRRFFQQWAEDAQEHSRINEDHAAGRIPWLSFKPPSGGWAAIINGSVDAAIRAKAQRYVSYTKPVLATFHHEPWGDGTPADFEAAFFHILDVMEDEVGGLNGLTYCPIFNGFNLNGAGDAYFSSGQFQERCNLIGFDHYGRAPEIETIMDHLLGKGIQQLAIGEFGRGNPNGNDAHSLTDFEAKLDLFRERKANLSVVCYWNSLIQYFGANPYPNGPAYKELWDAYASESVWLP